jgi:hypothetical protein
MKKCGLQDNLQQGPAFWNAVLLLEVADDFVLDAMVDDQILFFRWECMEVWFFLALFCD